jgi:hypothetical protein
VLEVADPVGNTANRDAEFHQAVAEHSMRSARPLFPERRLQLVTAKPITMRLGKVQMVLIKIKVA